MSARSGLAGFAALALGYGVTQSIYTVQPGNIAIKFSRLEGLKPDQYSEGWHFKLPFFERPIIFNIQTKHTTIKASTANKDMQNVNLSLRVLYRPQQSELNELYRYVGLNYDERVLPSIVNEVLKSVVAQYSANELLSQRDQVSFRIKKQLEERAGKFYVMIDDVSITELGFNKEFTEAIEAKQVAQQEAQKAFFIVQQARETKKSIIIKAQGDAKSIELVGKSAANDPAYVDIRRIEYAKQIAQILSESRNSVILDSSNLNLNLNSTQKKK